MDIQELIEQTEKLIEKYFVTGLFIQIDDLHVETKVKFLDESEVILSSFSPLLDDRNPEDYKSFDMKPLIANCENIVFKLETILNNNNHIPSNILRDNQIKKN